jgi:hypothetical protein
MVRSRIDESIAGQSTLRIHQRQSDDWPRRGVTLRECRTRRDFYETIREGVYGHKYLEQERGGISIKNSCDDRVGFSRFFRCIQNILQLSGMCNNSLFVPGQGHPGTFGDAS